MILIYVSKGTYFSSNDVIKSDKKGDAMIYVLSLNPSIDYHMEVPVLEIGETNRSKQDKMQVGGKGINVATLLNNLQRESTLIGFVGGQTGLFINQELDAYPYIHNATLYTNQNTRINVKIKGQVETEINGSGQDILQVNLESLQRQIDKIDGDDIVVITGSLAKGMPLDWYTQLAAEVFKKGAVLVVDIATKELLDICQYNPLLVKPNIEELELIFEQEMDTEAKIIFYAKKLIEMGAQNCIVSLGNQGSFLVNKTAIYKGNIPNGKLINSVGAGDSMVAGFIDAFEKTKDVQESYRYAIAASSATAYTDHIAKKETIETLLPQIEVERYYGT